MGKFIGYTVGLECNHADTKTSAGVAKMVKAEYTRNTDGTVTVCAISGHDLGGMKTKSRTISSDAFADRPFTDNVSEARWALGLLGWAPMSEDFDASRV